MSHFYGDDWGVFHQPPWQEMAVDREITGGAWRVLIMILATAEYRSRILVRTGDLAEWLEMHPSAVSQHISVLLKKGILQVPKGRHRRYGLEVNPVFWFKGDPERHLDKASPGGEPVLSNRR